MYLCFAPIFLFLALRFNYGNDYIPYYNMFREIANATNFDYRYDYWHAEFGWLFINKLFSELGFFSLVAALAIINCYAYADFIRKYVPQQYYWLALFFYIFNAGFMLVQISSMRQTLAINIFLYSIRYIISKKFLAYIILIYTATLFHTSAWVLMPLYFLSSTKTMVDPRIFIGIFLFYFTTLVLDNEISNLISFIISKADVFEVARYAVYEDKGSAGSGIGISFSIINLVALLIFYNNQNGIGKFLFGLSILNILLLPLSVANVMLGRFGLYLSSAGLATIPLIALSINQITLKWSFIILNMLFYLYGYLNFFNDPIWAKSYSNYFTIF